MGVEPAGGDPGEIEGSDKTHRWLIDPLDGTTNFLHGIPIFAISIALEREGQLVAGVVYNPANDDMFAKANIIAGNEAMQRALLSLIRQGTKS